MLYCAQRGTFPLESQSPHNIHPFLTSQGGYNDCEIQCCGTRQSCQPLGPQEVLSFRHVQRTQEPAPIGGADLADVHRLQHGHAGGAGGPADGHPAGTAGGQHCGVGRLRQFLAEERSRRRRHRRGGARRPDHQPAAALQRGQGVQEGTGHGRVPEGVDKAQEKSEV